MKAIVNLLVFSLALWLTTLIVGGNGQNGVWVEPLENNSLGTIISLVVVAILFSIVNITVGSVLRFLSFPLRLLTLGLFTLVINALLLMLVGWISNLIGFGLHVDSFWWALLGALVLAVISMLLNAVFGTKKRR